MDEAKIVQGERGGRILASGGFQYQLHHRKQLEMTWRCWRRPCHSKLFTNTFDNAAENPDIQIRVREEHNHPPDDDVIDRRSFVDRCRAELDSNPTIPIKRVYESEIANEQRRVARQGGGDRPQVPQFQSVRSQLHRSRSSMIPEIPDSIDDVDINGQWAETWNNEQFLVHQDNDWGLAIFATEDNLRVLRRCRHFFMDATFRTCPKPYTQVFNIIGIYKGHTLCLATALMTNRTVADYRRVLFVIRREVRRVSRHRWRPTNMTCDFEQAIISAVGTEFPNIEIGGCYFHFTNNMWKHVQDLGLARAYRQDEQLKKVIRKLMALGYLPRALVRMNFDLLRRRNSTARLMHLYPALADFFDYVSNNYINGQYPITLWNVYDRDMETRTNNRVESEFHL